MDQSHSFPSWVLWESIKWHVQCWISFPSWPLWKGKYSFFQCSPNLGMNHLPLLSLSLMMQVDKYLRDKILLVELPVFITLCYVHCDTCQYLIFKNLSWNLYLIALESCWASVLLTSWPRWILIFCCKGDTESCDELMAGHFVVWNGQLRF